MAQTDDEYVGNRKSHVPTRLVTAAQEKCHRARQQYLQSRYLDKSLSRATTLNFHLAVLEYYEELRPLREKSAVEDFWTDAVLFQRRVGTRLVDSEGRPLEPAERHDDGSIVSVVYADEDPDEQAPMPVQSIGARWEPEIEEVTGLDSLPQLANRTTTQEKEVSNSFGETSVQEETIEPLDGDVLLQISRTLDDAAEKLGFAPEAPDSKPRTELTDDLLEEVREWRQKKVE
jgi:hypothetical protein